MREFRAVYLLGLLLSTEAWAAKRTEVAVVGLHVASMSDEDSLAAAQRVVEALNDTDDVSAIEPGKVRGLIVGREPLVVEGIFLGPGRAALAEGRVLYERADFESAIPVLDRAVDELQAGMAGATSSKDLIDALLILGLAHVSTGDADAARAAFKRVAVLDPTRELDRVNYPPKMVALFDEVRGAVLALPAATLQVSADESGAEVYVNGVKRGFAPVKVTGLPPGTHYVLVSGADGHRTFSRLDLNPGETVNFQAPLDNRALAGVGGSDADRARQTRQLYQSLGQHVATPLVLLGGELPSGQVALQLYETRTGNFSQIVSAPAGNDAVSAALDLVPTVVAYVSDAGTLRPDRVSGQVAALDIDDNALLSGILLDPEPIVEIVTVTRGLPWYAWTGIAAVAAGGAATAVLVLSPDPTTGNQPDPNQGTIIVGPLP